MSQTTLVDTMSLASLVVLVLSTFGPASSTNNVNIMSSSPGRVCATSNGADPSSFSPPLYTESHRPQIHFSPTSGFMNDPNGLVKSGDTWHMYYQYNPTEMVAGNQHWGHATSKDLYTWDNHPIALAPNQGEGIFSGSAVLDVNNTSGFFDDSTEPEKRFVTIYTLNTGTDQNQNVAYSTDGVNYTKYEGNPVISLNSTQFRDPKVFWSQSRLQWVMVVSHAEDYQVGFYGSSNLKSWLELSRFKPAGRLIDSQLECPDLLRVPVEGGVRDGQMAWLIMYSATASRYVFYLTGEWDGEKFIPQDEEPRTSDFGREWYATQSFYNGPANKAIAIGWASNWLYANDVPTKPYRGVMSTPRELRLIWTELKPNEWGYQLAQVPYNLGSLAARTLEDSTESANKTIALDADGAFEILARFSRSAFVKSRSPSVEFQIRDSTGKGVLKVGFTFGKPVRLYVDRTSAGSFADHNSHFAGRFEQLVAPLYRNPNDPKSDQIVEIQLVIDRTISEVFAQRGLASSVVLTYWDDDSRPASASVCLGDDTVKVESLRVRAIDGTWPECP